MEIKNRKAGRVHLYQIAYQWVSDHPMYSLH